MANNTKQHTGFFGGGGAKPKDKPCGFCNGVRGLLGMRPTTGQKMTPPGRYPNA